MAKTVYKRQKQSQKRRVAGKPGGKKISKTKITGMPVKRKRNNDGKTKSRPVAQAKSALQSVAALKRAG